MLTPYAAYAYTHQATDMMRGKSIPKTNSNVYTLSEGIGSEAGSENFLVIVPGLL